MPINLQSLTRHDFDGICNDKIKTSSVMTQELQTFTTPINFYGAMIDQCVFLLIEI